MDSSSIREARLFNQQLIVSELSVPEQVVSWMGAIQAQDFNMTKWAVGVRTVNSTDSSIEDALNRGKIIRTHLMRPTWHLVSHEDIYWMLNLSAPKLIKILRSFDKQLGLDKDTILKTNLLITDILDKKPDLTRQEVAAELEERGIHTGDHRLNHIMMSAEQEGIVCNGIVKGKKQTYDLLEKKVPKKDHTFDKDESLKKLATKYFQSHGPATLQDFVWWSALNISDAKRAMEIIRPDFIFENIGEDTYIFHPSTFDRNLSDHTVHLLPAFDELFVSYKDRKEVIDTDHLKKVIVSNGVFKPTVFLNGKITGIWNRVVKKGRITAETACFSKINKNTQQLITAAEAEYNHFANN